MLYFNYNIPTYNKCYDEKKKAEIFDKDKLFNDKGFKVKIKTNGKMKRICLSMF